MVLTTPLPRMSYILHRTMHRSSEPHTSSVRTPAFPHLFAINEMHRQGLRGNQSRVNLLTRRHDITEKGAETRKTHASPMVHSTRLPRVGVSYATFPLTLAPSQVRTFPHKVSEQGRHDITGVPFTRLVQSRCGCQRNTVSPRFMSVPSPWRTPSQRNNCG